MTTPTVKLPNLPDDFWAARPGLKHIQLAAHSRGRSADLVFHAVLARMSAMADPKLRVDAGMGAASLNHYVAAVGPSGAGKTAGVKVARDLVAVPQCLTGEADDGRARFYDGISLGSGEGVAEAYLGSVWRELPDGELDKKGEPKREKIRTQVRHNVLLVADEGEGVTKMMERAGATIGPVLRSAWVGETLGQANASEERWRMIEEGTYSLGLLIAYQPETAAPLLADSGTGTTQRFAFAAATDGNVPDEQTPWPGMLDLHLTERDGAPITGDIQCVPEIEQELWDRNVAIARGEMAIDPLDTHEPLWRLKVAALLALMDGRFMVQLDDWNLAWQAWVTSCDVRDALITHGAAVKREEEEVRAQLLRERAVATQAAVGAVPAAVRRVANALARRVIENGAMTLSEARRSVAYRDRDYFEPALEIGEAEGMFIRHDTHLQPPKPSVDGW